MGSHTPNALLLATLSITPVAWAQDRPPLRVLNQGIEVTPLRIAPVRALPDGRIATLGPWEAYEDHASMSGPTQIFDAFGDANADGHPDGGIDCGLSSEGSRWFFGTAYCNTFVTADHQVAAWTDTSGGADRFDFAWYWSCNDDGTYAEGCIIAVITQDSEPCDPNSFDYVGWAVEFGDLQCNPGGYYFASASRFLNAWPLAHDGRGSHVLYFGKGIRGDGTIEPASCAQPMLWGTSNERPGAHSAYQFDDDNPTDGFHDPIECYTYNLACPEPLGAMVQMWSSAPPECAPVDFDANETVDSRDFLAFLREWSARNPVADCNQDGRVHSSDFLCFLNHWTLCVANQ